MKKTFSILTVLTLLTMPSFLSAASVVTADTGGASAIFGGDSQFVQTSVPAIQNITTSLNHFSTSMFGTAPTIGEQVPSPISTLNGVSYDVWMSGPVLSRYYNTNMYNANRSHYMIDGTLPLNNETIIPGAFGYGIY